MTNFNSMLARKVRRASKIRHRAESSFVFSFEQRANRFEGSKGRAEKKAGLLHYEEHVEHTESQLRHTRDSGGIPRPKQIKKKRKRQACSHDWGVPSLLSDVFLSLPPFFSFCVSVSVSVSVSVAVHQLFHLARSRVLVIFLRKSDFYIYRSILYP